MSPASYCTRSSPTSTCSWRLAPSSCRKPTSTPTRPERAGARADTIMRMVERGSILGEKYLVGRTLGSGGMGIIVEATHLQLGTQVAVKVLRAKVTEKPEAAERFLREARAAA